MAINLPGEVGRYITMSEGSRETGGPGGSWRAMAGALFMSAAMALALWWLLTA